jgi:deoxyribonuclease-2
MHECSASKQQIAATTAMTTTSPLSHWLSFRRSTHCFFSPLVRLLRGFVQMPKDATSKYPNIVAGLAYLYGDAVSRTRGPGAFWTDSSQSLGSASSAVGRTLSQIYSAANSASTGYLFYNDELPTGPSSGSYGHTKGQLMWSATGGGRGFWLIHSVPKLAESPVNGGKSYSYPPTAIIYGQSFLCISLNLKGIDTAFVQMQYNNPQVYGKKWVASLAPLMPNANAFMTQNKVNKTPISNIINITSVGGTVFTHFAKTSKWGKSIFGDLIGPHYGSGVLAETWQRPYEPPEIPPSTGVPVYSVLTLAAPSYANWNRVTWVSGADHSKWNVMTSGLNVVCIGDINKQLSQFVRAGGMACIQDTTVHQAFTMLIATTSVHTRSHTLLAASASANSRSPICSSHRMLTFKHFSLFSCALCVLQ